MLGANKQGREIEFTIYGGTIDDIQIDSAYYTDDASGHEQVPDEDIDYLMEAYADEIAMEWHETQIGRAETLYDLANER